MRLIHDDTAYRQLEPERKRKLRVVDDQIGLAAEGTVLA